ncbi:MAG: ferredoxin FdxA [Janthinobacterium lividum]
MTFVVTGACIGCKYTNCVSVCPMDCFIEGPNFLVINPDECIDCSMCVTECPVGAIVGDREITAEDAHFIELNRELSTAAGWHRITMVKSAPTDHAKWAGMVDKLPYLRR